MISSAYIVPHPPIIIPGIGQPDDLKKAEKTISAMEKLGTELEKEHPDAILLVSPHAQMNHHTFVINSAPKLAGSFIDFGLDMDFEFENDVDLIEEIVSAANDKNIPVHLHESFLDHGTLTPLYYLAKTIKPKLVQLAFSMMDYQKHYEYGKLIGGVLRGSRKKIAVVASGDLSHRLISSAPAGYSPKGKDFDEKLIKLLSGKNVKGILNLDENLIEEAGECGLRSIIVILGILNEKYEFDILSYEGPFGVGYLTASLMP